MPDLLDIVRLDATLGHFRERDLGQPGGGADAQPPGYELEECETDGRIGRIEPARHDAGQIGFRARLKRMYHLDQGGWVGVGRCPRPHERDRLGKIAHVIVRPRE